MEPLPQGSEVRGRPLGEGEVARTLDDGEGGAGDQARDLLRLGRSRNAILPSCNHEHRQGSEVDGIEMVRQVIGTVWKANLTAMGSPSRGPIDMSEAEAEAVLRSPLR